VELAGCADNGTSVSEASVLKSEEEENRNGDEISFYLISTSSQTVNANDA